MSDEPIGCVVCGEQPRGEIFGKPVCHVNHAEEVVNTELGELIDEWRDNSNLRKKAWECADELEELLNE